MSDQDSSLFQDVSEGSADKSGSGKPAAQNSEDSTTEALAMLVGEGRKYKTVEDLAKGYLNADGHIEVLKNDNATLKAEVAKGKTLEEVLERVKQGEKQTVDTTDKGAQPFTAADIEKLVDARLTGRETSRTRDDNIRKTEQALKSKFGEKAKEVYLAKADTPQKRKALSDLAAVDPDSFVALFSTQAIVGNPADGQSVRGDTLNVAQATGRAGDSNCKEFYDAMRKKEPAKYYSAAIQSEIHKKLTLNPEKFLGRKVG